MPANCRLDFSDSLSATVSWVMTFEIAQIIKSKQAYRAQLATRPIAEKLRMLGGITQGDPRNRGESQKMSWRDTL